MPVLVLVLVVSGWWLVNGGWWRQRYARPADARRYRLLRLDGRRVATTAPIRIE